MVNGLVGRLFTVNMSPYPVLNQGGKQNHQTNLHVFRDANHIEHAKNKLNVPNSDMMDCLREALVKRNPRWKIHHGQLYNMTLGILQPTDRKICINRDNRLFEIKETTLMSHLKGGSACYYADVRFLV